MTINNLAAKFKAALRTVLMMLNQLFVWSPIYFRIRKWSQTRTQVKNLEKWDREGRPMPPPHVVKERVIRQYASQFGIRTLVETGTAFGDMVEAMRDNFDRIYSIELSKRLYCIARRRFSGVASIVLIHGDSGVELETLVKGLTEPALFWLDGHYSAGGTARGTKDTPIYEELKHIFNARRHGDIILIDDARCFGTYPAYPSLPEIQEFIVTKRPDVTVEVEDDIIRVCPSMTEP